MNVNDFVEVGSFELSAVGASVKVSVVVDPVAEVEVKSVQFVCGVELIVCSLVVSSASVVSEIIDSVVDDGTISVAPPRLVVLSPAPTGDVDSAVEDFAVVVNGGVVSLFPAIAVVATTSFSSSILFSSIEGATSCFPSK